MISRSHLLSAACFAFFAMVAAPAAVSQNELYPNKPIKLIVPTAPGGATDLTARTIAQKMSELIGQPVVVENRAGANNIIGAEAVSKSVADSYTILIVPRETMGINPSLYTSLSYDPLKSFAFIGIVTEGPYVLVVNPLLGVKGMSDLMVLAKAKSLSYGSFGVGSMAHLNME